MKDKENGHETGVGEMRVDRETMADGRRYIIYYTFENDSGAAGKTAPDDLEGKTEGRENV